MFELSQLYFFLGATLALLLVPGPAVLYIVARSVNQGHCAPPIGSGIIWSLDSDFRRIEKLGWLKLYRLSDKISFFK